MAVATMSGCIYLASAFDDEVIATLGSETDTSGTVELGVRPGGGGVLVGFYGNRLFTIFFKTPTALVPGEPLKPAFSHDGKHLVSGTRDGHLHIWSSENGSEMARLAGEAITMLRAPRWLFGITELIFALPVLQRSAHNDAVTCAEFNPRYMMIASADSSLAFWLPDDGSNE
jgi:WD40 repeat protein